MRTELTKNGLTTTEKLGQEQFEKYKSFGGQYLYQYDYRHTDGELFSTVKTTLEDCRDARNKWLAKKESK